MASLGTLSGTFLVPGVSRNGRLYRKDLIEDSVADMAARLESGKPIPMMSCHPTESTLDQVAGIRKVWVESDGTAKYEAAIPDTRAGRDLAALTAPDPVTGERYLDSVSIYGGWVGGTRQVEHEGQQVVTGDKLLITRVDFVDDPGVEAARLDPQHAATPSEAALIEGLAGDFEPITESAPRAHFHDVVETAPAPATPAREASPAAPREVVYADPGWQADRERRYPLDSAANIRAAWAEVSTESAVDAYTSAQLATVRHRVNQAARTAGVNVSTEVATLDLPLLGERAAALLEALAAYEAMISISAYQGPADVDVRAFGINNDDVQAAATVIGKAAAAALRTLDPDGDDDLDIPGAGGDESGSDDPVSVLCGSCLVEVPASSTYCSACGSVLAEAASTPPDPEVPAMPETTEASPTVCPSCKANVSPTAEFCSSCGASTKKKKADSEAAPTQEGTVTETPNLAEQFAAGMSAAFEKYGFAPKDAPATTEAAPAAPATEAAPAPATETSPTGVTEAINAAMATEREAADARLAEALKTNNEQLVAGIGKAMGEGFTQLRDELRAEIGEAGGHQRTGVTGSTREERLRATAEKASEEDGTPWHTLPAHERDRRHQDGLANQMSLSGIYSDGMSEAVRTQSRHGA